VAFDISCLVCGGPGCPSCKKTGWVTVLGAGMVHPVVLRNGGLDPERYQGWAFGMGLDRITGLRHAIPDIRVLLEGDVQFLEAF
jgi:phenylalanyl-tRNA synthetase alpha chain